MERMICKNGHFYDGDKFQECPHCAAGMEAARPSSFAVVGASPGKEESGKVQTGEKKKLFGHRRAKRTQGTEDRSGTEDRTQILPVNMQGAGDGVLPGSLSGGFPENFSGSIPGSFPGQAGGQSFQPNDFREGNRQSVTGSGMVRETSLSAVNGTADFQNITQKLDAAYLAGMGLGGTAPAGTEPNGGADLAQAGSGTAAVKTGRGTESGAVFSEMGSGNTPKNDGKTVGYFSVGLDTEPPVGYLICTEGEDYGTGFPLKSGINSLGRSSAMDVVVMDVKVSREKQAFVMYEPHKREFFLKPGDGVGLCYLNDELVLEPKKLKAYDLILLGDTKLMLIPVCGEQFSW
ncbi:MAG: hypothetical protein NC432_07365 [Roseburia sp.]|nr:hypothetical protein [Roseburia sp.]MCM1096840.1 hypothetical protein [Ruminococcus flavefaciens]